MNQDITNLIKSTKIFATLPDEELQKISPLFTEFDIRKDDVVFSQGDISSYLYLLANGRLSVILTNAQYESKVISFIEPGQTFGELAALANEPMTFTAKALQNSTVLRLRKQVFTELCHKYPALMLDVIERTQEIIQILSPDKARKHIALMPAHAQVNLQSFSEKLTKYIKKTPSLALFSDYEFDKNGKVYLKSELEEIISQIAKNKKPRRKILYLLKSTHSELAQICFKKADTLYIIAHHDSVPHLDKTILDHLYYRHTTLSSKPELVLLYPDSTVRPKDTQKWLTLASFHLHHHIRQTRHGDYARLLRFIREKAVGLVLGGGGTRGWAHVGAIKALQELNIPIDIIGGTSVGSIIAGCYSINPAYKEIEKNFEQIVKTSRNTVSLKNITWPAISLFDGKNFTIAQEHSFKNLKIEDLWISYFCVSCNFTTHSEAIHRDGLLWEKIRSSSSIPGLIPPMILNEELHFDGSLLNDLPVDVMRQLVGKRGKIIAIDLLRDSDGDKQYNFPPVLTFFEAFFSKLGWGKKKYKYPPFLDTFLKALLIGSALKAKQNSMLATIFISLDLEKYALLHSTPKHAQEMMNIGYKETIKKLRES